MQVLSKNRSKVTLLFAFLEVDDQSAIEAIEQEYEFLRGKLKEDIRKGNLCLAVFHDGNVAGFNAIAFDNAYMILVNYNRTFRPGEAWSVHIAVFEDYRRMGLASNLRYQIFEELKQRGYKRLYGGVLRSNTASLKLAEHVGFEVFVDIVYTRFLFFKRWKFKRVRP
jgi:ribosomal protein S18 acetylase RimI-like enzyme